jgi:hypothetical protein
MSGPLFGLILKWPLHSEHRLVGWTRKSETQGIAVERSASHTQDIAAEASAMHSGVKCTVWWARATNYIL